MAMGPTEALECRGGFLLFLITLASLLHNQVAAEVKRLDMAPNAVDDAYVNCTEQLMELVTKTDGLLQKELKENQDFEEMWNKNKDACAKGPPGLTFHHRVALQAYGNSKAKSRQNFNSLVQTKGGNKTVYTDQFPFKSLHFLLTEAMRLANGGKTCYTVFYAMKNKYAAENNTEIRFGRFVSAKKQKSAAIENGVLYSEFTLFEIESCSVVNFDNFTCKSESVNFLISPTEVFRVQNIQEVTDEDDPYTEIKLKSVRFLSNHNCYLISRTTTAAGTNSSSSTLNYSFLALAFSILVRFGVAE